MGEERGARGERRGPLPSVWTADRALDLCRAYGIPVAPYEVVAGPEQAVQAAGRLGYPLALKLLAARVVHKSDVGGVALDLADAEAVQQAARRMLARVDGPASLLVQLPLAGAASLPTR